jgi:cyclin-dependent kinase 10
MVALKRIILHNEENEGFPITSIREIATLRSIHHDNCVRLLDVAVGHRRDGVFLVFEYCEHDLSSLLDSFSTPFSESEVKSLVRQLLSAVKYLHERWIVHRFVRIL